MKIQGETALYGFIEELLEAPDKALEKKRGLQNSSMGLKYPIWFAACSYQDLEYSLAAPGRTSMGSGPIRLETLSLAGSSVLQGHPELQKLPDILLKYLQNFHHKLLGLPVSLISVLLVCWLCSGHESTNDLDMSWI